MKVRLQFGWLAVLGFSALMAQPSTAQNPRAPGAQNRQPDRPPKQQRQQERQQPRQQERRQPQQEPHRPPVELRNAGPPRHAEPSRNSLNNNPPRGSLNSRNSENRPPNATVRPPTAMNPQANARRFQDLSPQERQNWEKFNRLPPQKQQEMRERERVWRQLTPEQQSHLKNEVIPNWNQLRPDRQRAIHSRLEVLKNMPESARNQHLNDPSFTRGMSEEDKAMLRDLSHMHLGAPDPPNE